MDIASKGMVLVDDAGKPVAMGSQFAGYKIIGGSAPKYKGAKGRVYVQELSGRKRELEPDEIGVRWTS